MKQMAETNRGFDAQGVRVPAAWRANEMRFDAPLRDVLLSERYAGLSQSEIAADLGVSEKTLYLWMRRMGIETRRVLVDLHAGDSANPLSAGAETSAEVSEVAQ